MEQIQALLGSRLRQFRTIKDYSIEELSHKAGLNPAHLGKIERGESNFTIKSLDKILEALGISYLQLFDLDVEVHPSTNPVVEKTLSHLNAMTLEEQKHIYRTVQLLSDKK